MFRRLSKPSFVHISPTTHSAVSKYTDLRTLFTKECQENVLTHQVWRCFWLWPAVWRSRRGQRDGGRCTREPVAVLHTPPVEHSLAPPHSHSSMCVGRVWGDVGEQCEGWRGIQGRYGKRLVNENIVAVRNEWIPTMCTVTCSTHVHGHTVFQHGDPWLQRRSSYLEVVENWDKEGMVHDPV